MYRYAIVNLNNEILEEKVFSRPLEPFEIKPLSNGLKMARIIQETYPEPQPWQDHSGWTTVVQDTAVIRTPTYSLKPLSQLKLLKFSLIDSLLASKLEDGIEWPAASRKFVQIRFQDQPNISSACLKAVAALAGSLSWDPTFQWRMLDNTFITISTPNDMIEMASLAMGKVVQLRKTAWTHKDNVASLTTPLSVHQYDISGGW